MIKNTCKKMQQQLLSNINSYFSAVEKHLLAKSNSKTPGNSDMQEGHSSTDSSSQSASIRTSTLEKADIDRINAEADRIIKDAIKGFEAFLVQTIPGFGGSSL